MSSPEMSKRMVRNLARALLLPTPFAQTEPDAEPRRAQTVLAWLELDEHADDLAALHEACSTDAHGVHVPTPTGAVGEHSALRHPLSHQCLGDRPAASSAWDAWVDELCGSSMDTAEDWRRLWCAAGRAPWLASIPAEGTFADHRWTAHRTTAAALLRARWDGQDAALVFVHYGPVQPFIAAARRTSDLWLGSLLVSTLAYTAAAAVADACGPQAVIYPDLAALERFANPESVTLEHMLQSCVPNRFVCIVPQGEADAVAEAVTRAVSRRWKELADRVHRWLDEAVDAVGLEGFDAQIAAHPVVDIVAQGWPAEPDRLRELSGEAFDNVGYAYASLFKSGRRALAAVRMVAGPAPEDGDSRVKCSQCAIREAMGPKGAGRAAQRDWWAQVRGLVDRRSSGEERHTVALRKSEMLCAVCLTKRFARRCLPEFAPAWKAPEQRYALRFPSVASVAVAPFRLQLRDDAATLAWRAALESVHDCLAFTVPGNLLPRLGPVARTGTHLDPDGTWLYPASYELETCLRDHDDPEVDRATLREALERARAALRKMCARQSPTAYYAVVVLDVDDMGAWLDGSHACFPRHEGARRPIHAALHADVSRRQGRLATRTLRGVVEAHLGRMVYSGGDDVLAFVPLHTVWACLDALRARFRDVEGLGCKVGISVGVSIAHWKTPLQVALKAARDAESRAKRAGVGADDERRKNAVEVSVATRSGMPTRVRLGWDDLRPLQTQVNRLARDLVDGTEDGETASELLRPAGLESLRAELSTLLSLPRGQESSRDPLTLRVRRLTRLADFPPVTALLGLDDPARIEAQLIDLLALVRFLVREHRGIDYACPPEE